MPRSRNIKHGFFTNDDLAQNDPLGRLLFVGLWTLADYKGDLKWKTRRIKAQLLPYDDCDVEKLAINLDKSGFIRFYSDGDEIFVRVLNFDKHQNPHKNEKAKGSDVPEYSETLRQAIDLKGLTINRDKSGLKREDSTSDPADSCSLIPDPGNLIPDSKHSSTELATPDAVYYIPTNKYGTQGESYPVTEDDLANWAELYPAVNLQSEIRKIIGWSQSNVGKRKTLKGMPKFINSWLSRAQDKGGGSVFVTKAEEAEYYGQKYNEDQLL